MTTRDATAYLWDARDCGQRILRFIAGRTVEDYLADDLLRSAVERQFEIIGEAFTQLRRSFPEVAEASPSLPTRWGSGTS